MSLIQVLDEEEGSQISPAGFYLVQLPFSEDVRFNPAPTPAATAMHTVEGLYKGDLTRLWVSHYTVV